MRAGGENPKTSDSLLMLHWQTDERGQGTKSKIQLKARKRNAGSAGFKRFSHFLKVKMTDICQNSSKLQKFLGKGWFTFAEHTLSR